MFQCPECRINLASLIAMNCNPFPYGQMQNSQMRIVPAQSLFDPSIQIPFIQKKNNNKNNKKLSLINNNIQTEKNEEEEEESEIKDINDTNDNNLLNNDSKTKNIENIPQLINSFYFLNENLKNQNNQPNVLFPPNIVEESNKKINNSVRSNSKNKIKDKSKHKKINYLFTKNLLQILENFELTNEEKLLYIIDNYKNIKIDPLILKVLEYRKKLKKNGGYESKNLNILNGNQNNNSMTDGEILKMALNKKNGINGDSNNTQNSYDNNSYIPAQAIKINFPIDDKLLFQNLEKYKISTDILDRPTSAKINVDFYILNKLFIIWDFLITFKDTIFSEKVYDLEIDKNILTFYTNLLDVKNNYSYYKSIFISLLLLCVKNIPYAIQSPKSPRMFLLKSILDNLHSISYNIIYDYPLIVLKEVTECYLYNNSIEENNLKILKNVLVNANNFENKENFENNKKIFEKEEEKEDNIVKIDNDTKIYLLNIIIGLCFETILIKDKIKFEYDNMNTLSNTKKGLDESLFDTEKRMKELNRMENFKNLPKEIENMEKKIEGLKGNNKMELDNELKGDNKNGIIEDNTKEKEEEKNEKGNNINNINNLDDSNKKKEIQELETQIERYKSILTENEKLIERKKEINIKINEIIEKIYNLKTLRKKYLGIDYQSNEYYYFTSVPNKIYTKNKKKKEWGYFENKEDIQRLINKLTDKGKNEKKLKVILKFILSQMKEKEQKEEEEKMQKQRKEEEKKENEKNNINTIENKKEEEVQNKENKEIKKIDEVTIKIEKNQKNENEDENKKKNNNICSINLGPIPKKKSKTKPKEEISIDNIHILEDDVEEIIDDRDQEKSKENEIEIEDKENISLNKNKDKDKEYKTCLGHSKKELFTFVISEDRLQLNFILMKIDDVFSEYLVQFNKQWESEKNRSMWKAIITNNATDKNILTTLRMFNHKFKNPYKILSLEEEQELLLKEKIYKGNNFVFEEDNGNKFLIPETNNLLMLSPKVKIWSKEMDLIDIDNYYINDLLVNVYSREQLCYVVHFYEMAIFGLVHRREGKRKL